MNKLTDLIKRHGIIGCLQKTILKIGRLSGITYVKYFAYFKTLPDTIDANSLLPYRKMSIDDFKKQALFDEWFSGLKMKQIEMVINLPGYEYYGIYDNDKLICYGAVSMNYDFFTQQKLSPQAAYLFDDYTNIHYRGKGLHQKIVDIREYEAWKQNKSITFAYISSLNHASAKAFKRSGYVVRKKLIYKQIGKNNPLKKEIINI